MAEAIDDPVEIPPAEAVALGFGDRRPAAVLVADRRNGHGHRPTRWAPLPLVAEDEAPPDVEVAIEPEMLVERASGFRVGASERERIALDGRGVAGRGVLERTKVGADDAEPA